MGGGPGYNGDSLSTHNNGYKYVLTVIDVLSKYAWVEPLKSKTGESLAEALGKIIKKGRKPRMFHTDKGTEFINRKFQKFLKEHKIRFFTTHNETKASIVESDAERENVEIFYSEEYTKVRRHSSEIGQIVQPFSTS